MKRHSRQSSEFLQRMRPSLLVGAGLLAILLLFLFRLGSVPSQLSYRELQTHQENSQLGTITDNPLNAPYKLVDFSWLQLNDHSVFVSRLTSVGVALLAVGLFFAILYRWHGRRTALLGSLLFATSSWLLHVGRLGIDQSVWLIVPLALILLGSWLHGTTRHTVALVVSAIVLGGTLLVPGGVWFVIAFLVLLWNKLRRHTAEASAGASVGSLLIAIMCVGLLGFAFYRQPHLLQAWVGLPDQLPNVFGAVRQWLASVVYLFVRGPATPTLWLGHTPILDIFTSAICLLGGYFYLTHYRNLRTRTLAVFTILGSLLVGLNGPAAMSLVVPLAYLVAATGITFLLHEWLRVFPRNPVARSVGIALIAIAIICAVSYHLLAYFVAWHDSPATISAFQQNLVQ